MAGNIKGITVEFRGDTTELQKAINKIRRESKTLDSELKAIDRSLKFNPTSVTLWRQKQEALTESLKQTEKNLDDLKKAQQDLDNAGVDKNSAEYRELEREIIKCENQQDRLNKELRQIPTPQIRAAAEQMKQVGAKMKEAGSFMTSHFTAPIVAGYTAAAKYASDYEENLNKIDVAFGENSQSVKDWANNAREAFGLSKVQATAAVSSFGALGKGIGLTESEAAKMSTSLAGLSADLGSYFNASNEDSAKALEGIFTGEAEALKKFGVVMTETNLEKFAADQGKVYKEMTEAEKVTLRYNYVLAKTKDAQGDFARTGDGTANSVKSFKAALEDLATAIGTVLLPIVTPVIQKVAELINKFNELSPTAQKVITVAGLIIAAIGPVLMVVGSLATAIGNILTFGPAIIAAIGGVISTIAPAILIIGALVAAGVLLYKNWDLIKAKAIELWKQVKDTFNRLKASITATWAGIKATISNAWTSILSRARSAVNSIRATVSSVFNSLRATVASVWSRIRTAITTPIQSALSTVRGIVSRIKGLFPLSVGKIFSNLRVPTIKVSGGKSPFGIGGFGVAPSIRVTWHAQGGIFDRPTLLADRNGNVHGVGEAGPEAVMPLNPLWDKLDAIANAARGDITINVVAAPGMDVREVAEEVRRVLIQTERREARAW